MRDLLISPEVASYIGAEAVHRLRAHPALPTARCVDCDRPFTDEAPPAAVVLVSPDRRHEPDRVLLVHVHCGPSEVRRPTRQGLEDTRRRLGITSADVTPSGPVRAHAALLPAGAGPDRAVLVLAFPDLFTVTAAGDRVDVTAAGLLAGGWHLVTRLGVTPPPPTAPWRLRYQMARADRTDGGTLTLIDPTGPAAEWVGFHPPRLWLVQILDVPHCSLYLSPTPMRPDPQPPDFSALQAAARQGLVVAARVDVDFLDPFGRPARRVFDDVQHALIKAAPGGQGTPRRDRRHPPRGPH
jgi:hypothetical protein